MQLRRFWNIIIDAPKPLFTRTIKQTIVIQELTQQTILAHCFKCCSWGKAIQHNK